MDGSRNEQHQHQHGTHWHSDGWHTVHPAVDSGSAGVGSTVSTGPSVFSVPFPSLSVLPTFFLSSQSTSAGTLASSSSTTPSSSSIPNSQSSSLSENPSASSSSPPQQSLAASNAAASPSNAGMIGGIVAAVVVVLIAAILGWLYRRRRSRQKRGPPNLKPSQNLDREMSMMDASPLLAKGSGGPDELGLTTTSDSSPSELREPYMTGVAAEYYNGGLRPSASDSAAPGPQAPLLEEEMQMDQPVAETPIGQPDDGSTESGESGFLWWLSPTVQQLITDGERPPSVTSNASPLSPTHGSPLTSAFKGRDSRSNSVFSLEGVMGRAATIFRSPSRVHPGDIKFSPVSRVPEYQEAGLFDEFERKATVKNTPSNNSSSQYHLSQNSQRRTTGSAEPHGLSSLSIPSSSFPRSYSTDNVLSPINELHMSEPNSAQSGATLTPREVIPLRIPPAEFSSGGSAAGVQLPAHATKTSDSYSIDGLTTPGSSSYSAPYSAASSFWTTGLQSPTQPGTVPQTRPLHIRTNSPHAPHDTRDAELL